MNIGSIIVSSSKPSAGKPADLVNEGLIAGKKIAKISVITLLSIGVAEIITGQISGSVVATADGIDSLSDAMISFIVLIGLRIAHRPADRKFPFGYHKVESFAALIAAIGMIAIGIFIFYHSFEALLDPREIRQPILTMTVLAAAGGISLHRAFQMNSIANKYNLLSLKTDAKNSIKDGSASVIGFFQCPHCITVWFSTDGRDRWYDNCRLHIFSIIHFPQAVVAYFGRLVAEPNTDRYGEADSRRKVQGRKYQSQVGSVTSSRSTGTS